jgi:hypothetical protein
MLEIANKYDTSVSLGPDWGEFSATIMIGNSHTHIGLSGEDGDWDMFIDQLYNTLHDGPGLSWVQSEAPIHGHIPDENKRTN